MEIFTIKCLMNVILTNAIKIIFNIEKGELINNNYVKNAKSNTAVVTNTFVYRKITNTINNSVIVYVAMSYNNSYIDLFEIYSSDDENFFITNTFSERGHKKENSYVFKLIRNETLYNDNLVNFIEVISKDLMEKIWVN